MLAISRDNIHDDMCKWFDTTDITLDYMYFQISITQCCHDLK